jgi:hypothetical protein
MHVRGPQSYEDVRTFQFVVHPTFAAACRARGLIDDDVEWQDCIREAISTQRPPQIRQLYATVLTECGPSDPLGLWEMFKLDLCDDFLHRHRQLYNDTTLALTSDIENEALPHIESLIEPFGKKMSDYNLPTPQAPAQLATCRMLADELALSNTPEKRAALLLEAENLKTMMRTNNATQFALFEEIMASVDERRNSTRLPQVARNGVFFVDAPAGTGKTTLSKALLSTIRANGEVALATASSGIAATLMPLGRTAHSRYKLPFKPTSVSTCKFSKDARDQTRVVLMASKVLIWDEKPMSHRHLTESLDRSLQFIMGNNLLFGGIVVVFLGDFRQVLPVVKKGARHQIVDACLKKSGVWSKIKRRKLTKNMRVMMSNGRNQAQLSAFADYLLKIGDGTETAVQGLPQDFIKIPDHMCI